MNIILLEFGLCLAASMVAVGRTKPVDVGQQPTNVSSNTTEQRDFLGWHCNDDTVRQVVTDALTLHGSDIDLTQQYIQTNLNSLFQQTGGVCLLNMTVLSANLFFATFLLCFGLSLCGKISFNNQADRMLVWNCADDTLKSMTETVMQRYTDVDEITEFMTDYLRTYRGGGWAVLSVNYVRTVADMSPDQYAGSDVNVCYVSVPEQQLITILAKIN
uniref:Uncharacterized protein n=1 Tax=Plectus sambesii TaxID=2011161 RepID=A0A914VGM4_9BILA